MRNSKYTRGFRDSTVQLAMNGEQSALKIAADLDINPKTLYNWIRECQRRS
ncbi:MAG: transposase [Campylobacterota bacterium]|nr:transposase [Campylobacterota bacterium]MDQ1268170.1 transposase [Campylobacterota bacterium]MDQ1338281.1 transposase [Campylobacterota bacterium]